MLLLAVVIPSFAAGQGRWENVSAGWELLASNDTTGRSGEWRTVSVDGTWSDLDLLGYDGIVWLRRDLPPRPMDERSAIVVGPTRYGWFRLHAGNALLAQVGSPSHTMPYPQSLLFPFDSRIERTSVLLEFHRYRWGSDSVGDEVGPVEGGVFVGDSTALADQLELARRRRMMADLVPLLLATIFVVAGLYHLELYVRRRTQSAYLWFGLATLALAGNTIIYTSWVAENLWLAHSALASQRGLRPSRDCVLDPVPMGGSGPSRWPRFATVPVVPCCARGGPRRSPVPMGIRHNRIPDTLDVAAAPCRGLGSGAGGASRTSRSEGARRGWRRLDGHSRP